MAYRFDKDLEFLKDCSNDELGELLQMLVYDPKDGEKRLSESITLEHRYIKHEPDHRQYWDLIAAELQAFGANTFASIFRGGKGVLYREILCDVCKKLKVDFVEETATKFIELKLLQKLTAETLSQMTEEERKSLCKEAGFINGDIPLSSMTASSVSALLAMPASYKVIIASANYLTKILLGKVLVGRGAVIAAQGGLGRAAGVFFGPIGWAISGAWLAWDIAGAAYRVTTPAVIKIATLRLAKEKGAVEKLSNDSENSSAIL